MTTSSFIALGHAVLIDDISYFTVETDVFFPASKIEELSKLIHCQTADENDIVLF